MFPPAILGPETAAAILWVPGIFWFFLLENPHAHKIPRLREWKCQFYFYGRKDFSDFRKPLQDPPDPQSPKTPPATRQKFPKAQNLRESPRANLISPKVNLISPYVNVISPKVKVKYFEGIWKNVKFFEISCWGVTITGASNTSKSQVLKA